jgi:hypothetical protein
MKFRLKRTLKTWLLLESLQERIREVIKKNGNPGELIIAYNGIGLGKKPKHPRFWWNELTIYAELGKRFSPRVAFPIFRRSPQLEKRGKKPKRLDEPWEYAEREWYYWLYLFGKHFGWDEERIADLDIETGIALYQEIGVGEQLDREWRWSMSEIAYPYNKDTKKSEFHPYPRPTWMLSDVVLKPPKIKMRREYWPVGNVVKYEEPNKDQETIPDPNV